MAFALQRTPCPGARRGSVHCPGRLSSAPFASTVLDRQACDASVHTQSPAAAQPPVCTEGEGRTGGRSGHLLNQMTLGVRNTTSSDSPSPATAKAPLSTPSSSALGSAPEANKRILHLQLPGRGQLLPGDSMACLLFQTVGWDGGVPFVRS